jgi:hypothetical protein
MDETRARALLQLAAESQPEGGGVNIDLARSQGRRRLRWRRAAAAGGTALAAVAVIIAVAVPLGSGGRAQVSQSGGHRPASAVGPPRQFNPLIPYATFGWLARGASLDGGQIAPSNIYITEGRGPAWALTAFVPSRCNLTSQQVLQQLRHHHAPLLNCSASSSAGMAGTVTSVAPRVNGHLAFWTRDRGYLAWEYARRSWAWLAGPGQAPAGEVVKVAASVRYAVATAPSIKFPVRLTGLPSSSRVSAMYYVADGRVLRASQYTLTGSGPGDPHLTVDPASARSGCYFYPGQSARRFIHGYRVIVSHLKAVRGNPPIQQLCAAHADGMALFTAPTDGMQHRTRSRCSPAILSC